MGGSKVLEAEVELHPFEAQAQRVQSKFEQFEQACEAFDQGVLLLRRKYYGDAVDLFAQAISLFVDGADKDKATKYMLHCQRRAANILDLRPYDMQIYYNDMPITETEMKRILNRHKLGYTGTSRSTSRTTTGGRQSKGLTIRDVCYQMFDRLGPDAPVDEVTAAVLAVNPTSKFDKTHWAYYRTHYKKMKGLPMGKATKQKETVACQQDSTPVESHSRPSIPVRRKSLGSSTKSSSSKSKPTVRRKR